MVLTLFVLIFAIGVSLPIRRFLPGYRPAELEGVVYLLFPIFEAGLLALVQVCSVIIRLLRKEDL